MSDETDAKRLLTFCEARDAICMAAAPITPSCLRLLATIERLTRERGLLLAEHEANGAALADSCSRQGCSEDECDGWEGCHIREWAVAYDAAGGDRRGRNDMKVTTETGSVYLLLDEKVRRVGNHDMRRDGQWLKLMSPVHPKVGEFMVMELEPLRKGCSMTQRITSPVVSIEEAI